MAERDVELYMELEAPGVGTVANRPSSLECMGCGADVRVHPPTLVPEDDAAVEVMAEGPDGGVYSVEVYCSTGCRDEHLGVEQ